MTGNQAQPGGDTIAALKAVLLAQDELGPVQTVMFELAQKASAPGSGFSADAAEAFVMLSNMVVATYSWIDAAASILGRVEVAGAAGDGKPN